jgi:hypothetical protein
MPGVSITDGVKDRIYALACEAVNLFHEFLTAVIDRDATQLGHGGCPSRGTGAVHLQFRETPKLQ